MKLDVYDTYVRSCDGALVHFDVLVPENMGNYAIDFARQWLHKMGICYAHLDQQNCHYCHSEQATPEIERQINQHGYFIIQMEGCPAPV